MRHIKSALILLLVGAIMLSAAAFAAKVEIGKTTKKTAVYGSSMKYPAAVLPQGEPVIYKNSGRAGYYSVICVDGTTGLVSKSDLKYAGAIQSKYVGAMKTTTTLYKYRNGRMSAYAVLDPGTPVMVTGAKNGLAQIRTLRGLTGFVKTSSIRR